MFGAGRCEERRQRYWSIQFVSIVGGGAKVGGWADDGR